MIGFVERYAKCGFPGTSASNWNTYQYASRIWAEDSDGSCSHRSVKPPPPKSHTLILGIPG